MTKKKSPIRFFILMVLGFAVGLILNQVYIYFAPLSSEAKERIVDRELYQNINNIQGDYSSLRLSFNNQLNVLTKEGKYEKMDMISLMPFNQIKKACYTNIEKSQIELLIKGNSMTGDKPVWGISDAKVKSKIKSCVDNFAANTPIPASDVMFILNDPRIKLLLDYKPLEEKYDLFKKQESPTYATAYAIYSTLKSAYESKFNKSLKDLKTLGSEG